MSSNANNGLNTSPLYANFNNVTSNSNVNIGSTDSFMNIKYQIESASSLDEIIRKLHYMLVGLLMRRRSSEMRR